MRGVPFAVFAPMFDHLLTEQINPASRAIDSLPTLEVLRILNAEDRTVAEAVNAELPQIGRAVDAVVSALRAGGHLFYIGAGTSGRLGVLDAAECPPTFGVNPELVQGVIAGGEQALARATEATEDDPASGKSDLLARGFNRRDVVVGIAASGRTPYVLGAIHLAREMGAITVGISCTPNSDLTGAVDFPIALLTGPEVIAGSTRLKAGTATKLVLNMISTATMIQLGYVFGNLMVNVQPRNAKLLARAHRIVALAAGVSGEQAAGLLVSSGQNVKVAIVMGLLGLDRATAEARLSKAGGRVSLATSTGAVS